VIPPNPRATRRCARKKGGIGLKVPLFKGDLGGSSFLLLATGLLKHPFRDLLGKNHLHQVNRLNVRSRCGQLALKLMMLLAN
jgi:hypothetical protein